MKHSSLLLFGNKREQLDRKFKIGKLEYDS